MLRPVAGSVILALLLFPLAALGVAAQLESPSEKTLEVRVRSIEERLANGGQAGVVLFLFGAFCALWAQSTRRSPWLWFFLGVFFHVITVLALLYKNSQELRFQAQRPDSLPR